MQEPFDLYSHAIDANPFPYYADLRKNHPCYWSEKGQLWILTRYADVLSAAQDWETFSSAKGNLIDEIPGRSGNTLGTTDPPRHDRMRALVNKAFAKKHLEHLIVPTVEIASRQIDLIKSKVDFDFVSDFSSVITVEILFQMLGLPAREPAKIRNLVVQSISTDKKARGRNDSHNNAFRHLTGFLAKEIAKRRQNPADDLITHLANAEIDGYRLTELEVTLTTSMFVIAGVESLSSFMSIFALNLADETDARHRIVDDNSLMAQAIEESLRYNTSAQRFGRNLTKDIEMHGQQMKAGDKVALAFGAANRDPRKFTNPDIYDLDRKPLGHLGFGAGKHFCIGTSLARQVTQTAMLTFLAEIPAFRMQSRELNWVSSSNFRSPLSLPMRIA
ncbi:MAG: cytochrome P450 [Rhodobacteraceae bacterium]|nr:cytochrome P450 [Paracoccaceae bacterium]